MTNTVNLSEQAHLPPHFQASKQKSCEKNQDLFSFIKFILAHQTPPSKLTLDFINSYGLTEDEGFDILKYINKNRKALYGLYNQLTDQQKASLQNESDPDRFKLLSSLDSTLPIAKTINELLFGTYKGQDYLKLIIEKKKSYSKITSARKNESLSLYIMKQLKPERPKRPQEEMNSQIFNFNFSPLAIKRNKIIQSQFPHETANSNSLSAVPCASHEFLPHAASEKYLDDVYQELMSLPGVKVWYDQIKDNLTD